MSSLPEALPIVLVLAVLIGIFVSLQKEAPSARVRLWTWAWALSFLHLLLEVFEIRAGVLACLASALDFAALEAAAIVFLASVLFKPEESRKRSGFLFLLGVPMVAHSLLFAFHWEMPWLGTTLIAAVFFAGAAFAFLASERWGIYIAAALALIGIGAAREEFIGNLWGVNLVMTLSYALTGVLFWRAYRRSSLGVNTVVAGFFGWACIYPIGTALHYLAPSLHVPIEFWNVPRILVALGMILTLLEGKSRAIQENTERAHAENQLLERLSHITSRLLAGQDPVTLCAEVARAIAETSTFGRAALFLLGEDRRFYLAGSSGFTRQEEETLREHSGGYAIESLKHRAGTHEAGSQSFRMSDEADLVLIPMVSWRGSHAGCLYLSGSKGPGGLETSEMVKLEVFASDLAVTLENVRLHQQLVRSEKLAGLGQLVAGVAHELNNPLTGVIGYADLLREQVREGDVAARIEKLANEARRMQRIVDGLLRFGRQNNSTLRSSNLASALHDVVQLREYHLRARGIQLKLAIDEDLPPVGIGEDELKQVLLNILNNSIDAISESVHRNIEIHASHHDGRVLIQFDDSGPGFADLNRAFDPFYTTKPAGKGTGLGLSICYGIVHECSGEITLTNNQPYGARVAIDIPVAVPQTVIAPSSGQTQQTYPLISKRAL
ncbi:MAG TPA: ATP-binding protein [Candidatus Aquilonibacter sp.]|nr:ATP-binding protein [Candidatus Aquilonibacter sp.]